MTQFTEFAKEVTSLLKENNRKLDKLCALMSAQILLQESVSPEGEVRTAEECAEILSDTFFSATALDHELNARRQQFEYHLSEFFIETKDEEEEKKDDSSPPEMQFN